MLLIQVIVCMVGMNLTEWPNGEDDLYDKGNDESTYIMNSVNYRKLLFIATGVYLY